MNERQVLEQRIVTLTSLLDASQVLGPAGTSLSEQLRRGWLTERRLLQRLLDEAPGTEVRPTIELWQARTAAFQARSDAPDPAWTDQAGHRWAAEEVMEILADTVERLDSWLVADDALPDNAEREG